MHIDVAVLRNSYINVYNSVINAAESFVAIVESAVVVVIVDINLSLVVVYCVIERLIILLRNYLCFLSLS